MLSAGRLTDGVAQSLTCIQNRATASPRSEYRCVFTPSGVRSMLDRTLETDDRPPEMGWKGLVRDLIYQINIHKVVLEREAAGSERIE